MCWEVMLQCIKDNCAEKNLIQCCHTHIGSMTKITALPKERILVHAVPSSCENETQSSQYIRYDDSEQLQFMTLTIL